MNTNRHGEIAGMIFGFIYVFLQTHKLGQIFGANTGFRMNGNQPLMPDVAFITHEKIPDDGLLVGDLDIVPDLVVEVISAHDQAVDVKRAVWEWLEFGVRLVWVIYPNTKRVYVYQPHDPNPYILGVGDVLGGGDVLSGFSLPLEMLFSS